MPNAFTIRTPEEQLADELRRRLRLGEWGDRLPGQRVLMVQFGVSRPMLEKAVARLKVSGELADGRRRAAYRAVARKPGTGGTGSLLIYSLAPEQHTNEALLLLERMLAVMPAPADRLRVDRILGVDEIVDRVLRHGASHVLMAFLPTEAEAPLLAAGRRLLVVGRRSPGGAAPTVGTDHRVLLAEAFRRVFAAGHKRLSTPVWRKTPAFAAMVREVAAAEYARAGLPRSPEFDTPVIDDPLPGAMHDCVVKLFRITPPTALILHEFPQWMAATSVLSGLRLRVPEEVSTVLLLDAPELRSAHLAQSHFRQDTDRIVAATRTQLRRLHRGEAAPDIWVAPIWVPGATLVPPRAGA